MDWPIAIALLRLPAVAYVEICQGEEVCKSKTRLLKVVLVVGRKLFRIYIPNWSVSFLERLAVA